MARLLRIRGSLSIRCVSQEEVLPHVFEVREDEGFVHIKAAGNDVLCIFHSKAVALF